MAAPQVKFELKITPKEESDYSASSPSSESSILEEEIKEEDDSAQTENSLASSEEPSDGSTLTIMQSLLKLCEDLPQDQQLKITEGAIERARIYFQNVEKLLNEYSPNLPSCKTRLQEIAAIHKRKKMCEVRIGFLGGTGTGKSSLINALLQMKVLPRNEEVSSTAVPVEVSYNTDADLRNRFKAVIEGISKAEFTKEIEMLFKYKELYDKGPEGENGEADIEAYRQMTTTIEKIKWVYPYLQGVEDLDGTNAEKLLGEPYVQKMLDSKRTVQASSESEFAHVIKKYIESSRPRYKDETPVSLWPLVKVVRIFVKAEILRPGIILVDLPGSHDTSIARSAVADNYRKNLTATVVCAPAVRAGSDKVAQELLGSVERRNMQLDGLYTSDSLFFVITKIDDLMDYKAYVKDHENLQDTNAEDMQIDQDHSRRIRELQLEIKKKEQKQLRIEGQLGKLKSAQYDLNTQAREIMKSITLPGHKRKRVDELTESDESMLKTAERNQIQKLRKCRAKISECETIFQDELKELYHIIQQKELLESEKLQARSRILKGCIQNRAQIHVKAARDEYERVRRMMGQDGIEKPLQVFSVSADAFTRLLADETEEALRKGFSELADTGIPALTSALDAITWGIRQQNARSFIGDVESCHARMKLWSADTSSEYKMLDDEKIIVESRMDTEIKKLNKVFSDLHIKTRNAVSQLIKDNIYSILHGRAKNSAISAMDLVRYKWSGIPWSTHKAINRNLGVWQSYKLVDYDWNEELAAIFLDDSLIKSWTETFHKKRLDLLTDYESEVDKLILAFTELILASARDVHPAIDEALQSLRGNVLNLQSILKDEAATNFEALNNAAKEAHRTVKPIVAASWEDIYMQCGDESGKGLFGRNKERHQEHVKGDGGLSMYQKSGKAIEKALNKVLAKLEKNFGSSLKVAVAQLEEDLKIVVDRHSTDPIKTILSPDAALAKEKLRKALQLHFEELETAWGVELGDEKIKVEEVEVKEARISQELEDEEDPFNFNFDDFK